MAYIDIWVADDIAEYNVLQNTIGEGRKSNAAADFAIHIFYFVLPIFQFQNSAIYPLQVGFPGLIQPDSITIPIKKLCTNLAFKP